MPNWLIAAGGTGQETAAAVARLSYLAGVAIPKTTTFDSDTASQPQADPDSANVAGPRTRSEVLQRIQGWLRKGGAAEGDFLEWKNPAIRDEAGAASPDVQVANVPDLFVGPGGTLSADDDRLLDLILTPSQRQVQITDGFHGQPHVGALAFARSISCGLLDDLLTSIRKSAGADRMRIVFAGSITGGTGTAILPMLIQRVASQKNAQTNLSLRAVLQLQWFDLVDGTNRQKSADVFNRDMARNASCLVNAYLKETPLDGAVVLGLPRRAQRESAGKHCQPETMHFVPLTAGICAANLLFSDTPGPGMAPIEQGEYWAPCVGNGGGDVGDDPYSGAPSGPSLTVRDGRLLSVQNLLDLSRTLSAISAALVDEASCGNPQPTSSGIVRPILKRLDGTEVKAFKDALEALNELHKDILDWVRKCLLSKEPGTPTGIQPYARGDGKKSVDELAEDDAARVLGAVGRTLLSSFAPERRLLSKLIHRCGQDGGGRRAAWDLVCTAREKAIKRFTRG